MPVDANIPLQAQAPQVPDFTQNVAKAYQLKDLILGEQQKEQDMQRQSALRDIFSKADTSTPEGQAKLVQDVAKVDPTQAMAIQKNYTDLALTKAKTEQALTSMKSEQFDILKKRTDATAQALATIDTAAQGPMGKDPAAMNALYHHQLQSLSEQGILTPDDLKRMPPNYDPNFVHAKAMENKDHVDMLDKAQQRRQEQQRIGIEGYRASTEARQGEERIGIERQRLAVESAQPKSEVGKIESDYKAGRINKDEYDAAITKAGGNAGGGRAGVMNQRIINSANEATQDIKNLARLPITSDTGVFSDYEPGHGIAGVTKKLLSREVTSQDAQDYNVRMAGLSRSLSTLETNGLAPSGSLTKGLEDATTIKTGDSVRTKLEKMAEIRQVVDANIEAQLSSPTLGKDQKELLKKMQGDISKSIPYTMEDLDNLSTGNTKTLGNSGPGAKSSSQGGEDYSHLWQ